MILRNGIESPAAPVTLTSDPAVTVGVPGVMTIIPLLLNPSEIT
jgi:hypothetical protein